MIVGQFSRFRNFQCYGKSYVHDYFSVDYFAVPPLLSYREIPFSQQTPQEFDLYVNSNSATPFVMKSEHQWPASRLWNDPRYFSMECRDTFVPLVNRPNFSNKNTSSRLVKLQHYVASYLLKSGQTQPNKNQVYHISKYLFFDQHPRLKNDIIIPGYVDNSSQAYTGLKEIQVWIEPHYAITPLQLYRYPLAGINQKKEIGPYNLFVQLVGAKYYRIYSSKEESRLYLSKDPFLSGASSVDVDDPNFDIHPLFHAAEYQEKILHEGEMLFVPSDYYVYMKSLSYSCSLNFQFFKEKNSK
jgi:lysine-specific demethylase 8